MCFAIKPFYIKITTASIKCDSIALVNGRVTLPSKALVAREKIGGNKMKPSKDNI